MVPREAESLVLNSMEANKVLVLLGPRRVGKTMLLKAIREKLDQNAMMFNGEDFAVQEVLARRSVHHYMDMLDGVRCLIIDEAQFVPEIGSILKLMVDGIPGLKIVISGSSAFDISTYLGDPLTGRKKTLYLFGLSDKELYETEEVTEHRAGLHKRLVYGSYPELLQKEDNAGKTEYLKELIHSYLFKDILAFENLKNAEKIYNLLRLIAHQVGSVVSYAELGKQLSMSKNTVEKYLDLLTKVFVLIKVEGYSRNLRKEVTKSPRWYFLDNGVRNAAISNFAAVENRNDLGQLWENYMVSERLKYQSYRRLSPNNFFWRTYDQQEVDWVEEMDGKLFGYEFKWSEKRKVKAPIAWKKNYPESEFKVIHPGNYTEWLH
jgi:predicted AAA+ superfamily ATPase